MDLTADFENQSKNFVVLVNQYFLFFLQVLLSLVISISCEDTPKYPENPADISSINNLAYKPTVSLDPRIRKALLNVLNRLELQDNQQLPQTELITQAPSNANQTTTSDDGIKWEYKSNDTFKEYNYYEVVTSESKTPEPQTVDEKNEEPGALFFQIPDQRQDQRQDFEKHETLNLQETKNAIASSSDLLIGDLTDDETEKPKPSEPPATTPSTIPPKKEIKEITEKDVEVFQAPLLTAFTLEHDERGLPRRIIPLEQSELRSILDNRISPDVQPDVRRVRDPGPVFHVPHAPIPLIQEEKRIRFELETQLQQLQERKRQIEEKERLLGEQEKARRFKYALEQRQKEQEYLRALSQNEIGRPEIAFQKSVESVLPANTFERPSIVLQPLFPLPSKPAQPQYITDSVDRHLQHLFHRSGLGRQEDLNIVSKILALNHEGEEEKPKQKQPSNQERVNSELAARNQQNQPRILPGDQQRFTFFT